MQPGRLGYVRAFTRIELVAVLAALALLGAVALPTLAKSREPGRRVTCVNNLRQIARGWLMWAGEHRGVAPPAVDSADGGTRGNQNIYAHFLAASNEIGSPILLVCPSDDRQHLAENWTRFDSPPFRNNAVSYFAGTHVGVGVNAVGTPLSGDPNLQGIGSSQCGPAAIQVASLPFLNGSFGWAATGFHAGMGNAAFADGTVLQLTSAGLRQRLFQPVMGDNTGYEHILLPP